MKKILFLIILLFISYTPFTSADDMAEDEYPDIETGKYKALLIGINYENKDRALVYPENDAKALAEILQTKYEFDEVCVLTGPENTTKQRLTLEFEFLVNESKEDDSILIYYSGHGSLDKKANDGWWIPWDADKKNKYTWLSNRWIREKISKIKARHVLLIADACYSGTIFPYYERERREIDDKFYKNLYDKKSRLGITSAKPGEKASDEGNEKNNYFAHFLLKALEDNNEPYMPVYTLFHKFAKQASDKLTQTPVINIIDPEQNRGGEFLFCAKDVKKNLFTVENTAPPEPGGLKPGAIAEVMIRKTPGSYWEKMTNGDKLSKGCAYGFWFQPFEEVFLYLFQVEPKGKVYWLFPKNSSFIDSTGNNPIPADKWSRIPATYGKAYELDENNGEELFYMIAAREKQPGLEQILAGSSGKEAIDTASKITDALVIKKWFNHVSKYIFR